MPCNADALRLSIVQFICAATPGWSLVRLLVRFFEPHSYLQDWRYCFGETYRCTMAKLPATV